MAKGFESKQVEASQEAMMAEKKAEKGWKAPSPEEQALERKRENLELARKRALHQIEAAGDDRYKSMLQKGLADIEAEIAKLPKNRD